MAFFGLTQVFIPDQRMDEVAALLRRHGGILRTLYDASAGGYVNVVCFPDRRVVDRPLTGH